MRDVRYGMAGGSAATVARLRELNGQPALTATLGANA